MGEQWYLRTQDETFGPETRERLLEWARLGRIQPGQEISDDGEIWRRAEDVAFLDMRWSIDIGDGQPRGPFNKAAATALLSSGRLPPASRLVEVRPPFDSPAAAEPAASVEPAAPVEPAVSEPVASAPVVVPASDRSAEIEALQKALGEKEESFRRTLAERETALRDAFVEREAALKKSFAEKLAAAKAQAEELAEVRRSLAKLEDGLGAAQARAAEAERRCAEAEARAAEAEKAQLDAAAHAEVCAGEADAKVREAEARLAAAETRATDAEARAASAEEKVNAAREEVAAANQETTRAREATDAAEARIAAAREEASAAKSEVLSLSNEIKRLPPNARTAANVEAAVYALMKDEAEDLNEAIEYEKAAAEEARRRWTKRAERLVLRRQELLKRIGTDQEDMTRRALLQYPEDPRTVHMRQELDALRLIHERAAVEADAKIRDLAQRLAEQKAEADRLRVQTGDVAVLVRQLQSTRERLQLREKELLAERQKAEEARQNQAVSEQALLARLAQLENGAPGATRQSKEAHATRFPPWMGLRK